MPVLYFFRHGETDFNVVQRLQGRTDTPLNARGRQQADICAGVLRDLFARDGHSAGDFAYVSSPLTRARETAARLGVTPQTDPRLIEMSWGEWEGYTLAELRASFADIDELVRELGLPAGELNTHLTMMQVKKAVTRLPGSRYERR